MTEILVTERTIHLRNDHISYIIGLMEGGVAAHLYFGPRLERLNTANILRRHNLDEGGFTLHGCTLERVPQEYPAFGLGDMREGAVTVTRPDGTRTVDLRYVSAAVEEGKPTLPGLPATFGGACKTLRLTLADALLGLEVTLLYTIFDDCDVIARSACLRNGGPQPLTIDRAMSLSLDMPDSGYDLLTLSGSWAREREWVRRPLAFGEQSVSTRYGASGHITSPFLALMRPDATEAQGEVYAAALVYSGNFYAGVEVDRFRRARARMGINDYDFAWQLAPGEAFQTPEAVLTYSANGLDGMSRQFHRLCAEHLARSRFAHARRPILLNNWEATYFDFNERKLLSLAKDAAKLGAELFVLDDGWFGARDNDAKGLGDYTVNRKKLPGGLAGLAEKVHALGLLFGLWFEPEMVNADSGLFRAHPDWIVQTPSNVPATGRNQYVLDLCRAEVQDYIIANVNATLASAPIDYVKWDMNRHISDNYSPALAEQGRFSHSYILGLYRVLQSIVEQNPDVLFEGCSSGGNRFDLGILCYMPQIWTSDDTDAYERQLIQAGTSYGYPPSVMGCHVSASPNHQTARTSPIESRFNVAAFGVLGYELDLGRLTPAEQKAVAAQIAYYKAHRRLFQYGRFLRLCPPFGKNKCEWMMLAPDGSEAVVGEYLRLLRPNAEKPPLRLAGLAQDALYELEVRPQVVDVRTFGSLINQILPVKVNAGGHLMHAVADRYMMPCETERYAAYGDLLMYAGIRQKQAFTGTGYNENVRLMPDFSSRVYYLRRVDAALRTNGEEGAL